MSDASRHIDGEKPLYEQHHPEKEEFRQQHIGILPQQGLQKLCRLLQEIFEQDQHRGVNRHYEEGEGGHQYTGDHYRHPYDELGGHMDRNRDRQSKHQISFPAEHCAGKALDNG